MNREARRAQVLGLLENTRGLWVSGVELANAGIGGSEGLRRVRELRDLGYVIETRRPWPPREVGAWDYRLVDCPTVEQMSLLADPVLDPVELLRRHVLDWGSCDRPEVCSCSHAEALRFLSRAEEE